MIRRFERKDLEEVLRIEAMAFPKSSYAPELFLRYHHMLSETFLLFEEETVLGYIIFAPDGHVISLAVDPAHRRKGIGTYLMNACESRCESDRLFVEVREGNRPAQEFYERLGFQRKSRVRLYYGTEDAYVLEKELGSRD